MKPMNENSSITYNNVNNITYQGTQAQGGTFIYNNVKNIQKEAVELHNSSSSRSSNFGISTGATIGIWLRNTDYWKWWKCFCK